MSTPNDTTPAYSEEYEALLPEGWAEGDDFFDQDSWTGGKEQTDESAADDEQEEVTEEVEAGDEARATEQNDSDEGSEEESEEARATEQTQIRPKIKFSTQIDHKVKDVELDETELPTIYQKAHVTDRVKAKLAQAQPVIDKGNRLAKILGYESIDAMLDAAESSYRKGEVERLTGEGVHPDVANELVDSRVSKAVASAPAAQEDDDEVGARDFKAEVLDLVTAHPELKGKQLPEQVIQTCLKGRSLVGAYEEYVRKQAEAETRAVKAENKRLKQNADAARRAPVRGVSKGGAANNEPDDPFLAGFNDDRW